MFLLLLMLFAFCYFFCFVCVVCLFYLFKVCCCCLCFFVALYVFFSCLRCVLCLFCVCLFVCCVLAMCIYRYDHLFKASLIILNVFFVINSSIGCYFQFCLGRLNQIGAKCLFSLVVSSCLLLFSLLLVFRCC